MADPTPPTNPAPPGAPDDAALARAAAAGDAQARAALLTRHQDRLYAVCFRMTGHRETAADLTQDTMVRIIQGLPRFDGLSQVSTWMIRIAMNTCLSHLRAAKLRRHASLGSEEAPGPGGRGSPPGRTPSAQTFTSREPSPTSGVERRERSRILSAALASLDSEQRAILVLRDVQDLDYDEISRTLGIAVGTVKSRLFRARLALRTACERLDPAGSSTPPSPPTPHHSPTPADRILPERPS